MKKIYKPGQIITTHDPETGNNSQFRVTKCDHKSQCSCALCDMYSWNLAFCFIYCARKYNNWDKNPNGYVLKRI